MTVTAKPAGIATGSESGQIQQKPGEQRPDRSRSPLPPLKESKPGLEARAAVKTDSATTLAMRNVSAGRVLSRAIEERGNQLVYLFRIRPNGKAVREVWINAMTGAVIPALALKSASHRKNRIEINLTRRRF
jgi:uncharacterized membrane protein YkoI